MADLTATAATAQLDLAHFEAKISDDGRLLHYAKGRMRAFWLRQTLTVFGAVTVLALASPQLGLILAAMALVGEFVDILALRRVVHRLEAGQTGAWTRTIATLGGGVQGLTIAACVVLCWRFVPVLEARFFAAAFLVSACINAGIARPHFRPAADIRLAIFILTGFVLMAMDLRQVELATSPQYGFFAAGFGLLVYISQLLIRLLERNHLHRQRNEHELLKNYYLQQLAQSDLATSARNSQRLALVAKYANDSIVISGADGRIEWVNDAFTRITGYLFEEAVGQLPEILNAPDTDPATLARLQFAHDTQSPVRAEILNKAKDGRLLWMETSIFPIFDDQGALQLWIAVEREITEAKEREGELARARHAAEEAGQSKSTFLANMSHEIRTPMNGVIGVAELLSDTSLSPAQAGYVDTILESGKALLAIINDILDLAKLQSGKSVLEALPFSPKLCIEGVLRIIEPDAVKKGLDLRLLPPVPDQLVIGDEGKVRQIVLNLVGNAVKFTHSGAVTVTLTLPSDASEFLEIEVADSGIGIAQDRIDAIFESFSQADNGISRQFGGTGLGLTICSMLAGQMGGGIVVRSEIGRGSVFTLRARLPLSGSGMTAPIQPERRAMPRLRPGLTILVAEDNRTNMMIVRKMLQGAVHSLIEARDGEEAVHLYKERPPDLVLMDVSMPIKDGLQATRDIRTFERQLGLPRCPVVALTANAFGEDREACRQAGMDGFLVKPLSRVNLLGAVSTHCPDRSQRPRAVGQ